MKKGLCLDWPNIKNKIRDAAWPDTKIKGERTSINRSKGKFGQLDVM